MTDGLFLVARVLIRTPADAAGFGAVFAVFAGAAALGWRRRWLRHVAGPDWDEERNDQT